MEADKGVSGSGVETRESSRETGTEGREGREGMRETGCGCMNGLPHATGGGAPKR